MSVSEMAESETSEPGSLQYFVKNMRTVHCDEIFKKEIYEMFDQFILKFDHAEMWGFPFVDKNGEVRYLSNRFTKSPKYRIEGCRCGKQIDLDQKDWYVDENGCRFHPGKLVHFPKKELFSCCRRVSSAPGCVWRPNHVSSIRACCGGDFVRSQPKPCPSLPALPNIFALDCEMVYTTVGMEVAKVTVLSVFCDVVYDTFVKPSHPVIDYNTEFSGTDEKQLAHVTVDLKQVQSVLLQLFDTSTILVGHGLENDLLCLNLCHQKVIDTSILFPHERGFPYRHPLKYLAKTYLAKDIQQQDCHYKGHDSKEDAKTCLELIARQIFFTKPRNMKAMNSYLSKILHGYPQYNANLADVSFKNAIGMPTIGYRPPLLLLNTSWAAAYPGYRFTSVVYPRCCFGFSPPLLHFSPSTFNCEAISVTRCLSPIAFKTVPPGM